MPMRIRGQFLLLPLGLPVLPEVYMMMAGVEGRGGICSRSGRLLLLPVLRPWDTTSQKEISCTSSLQRDYRSVKLLSSTTQPNFDHCCIFFLKMQLTYYSDWEAIFSTFEICFQFRPAKHFCWVFLVLKNFSNFGVKDWFWSGEGVDRHLNFQLFPSFSTWNNKFSYKLFSNAMSSWLNSCLSHIVSIVGWKINVMVEVWTCYP